LIAVDTSVVVAAFASWHEGHRAAWSTCVAIHACLSSSPSGGRRESQPERPVDVGRRRLHRAEADLAEAGEAEDLRSRHRTGRCQAQHVAASSHALERKEAAVVAVGLEPQRAQPLALGA